MAMNFEAANPEWCVINTVDEMDNVFADTGIMLDFHTAIDNEMKAVEVVEGVLQKLSSN